MTCCAYNYFSLPKTHSRYTHIYILNISQINSCLLVEVFEVTFLT